MGGRNKKTGATHGRKRESRRKTINRTDTQPIETSPMHQVTEAIRRAINEREMRVNWQNIYDLEHAMRRLGLDSQADQLMARVWQSNDRVTYSTLIGPALETLGVTL